MNEHKGLKQLKGKKIKKKKKRGSKSSMKKVGNNEEK